MCMIVQATAELLIVVNKDKAEAEVVKARVAEDEAQVKVQAAETKIIADDAQADLDKAMPALNAAVNALNSLNKNDITEIKSFAKPPPLVQTTMEAVCVLLQEKPDWDTAKKVRWANPIPNPLTLTVALTRTVRV